MSFTYQVYEIKGDGSKDRSGDRKYTREFLVVTNNFQPDINADIFAAVPISEFDAHPNDYYAFARSKSVAMESPGFWTVKVDYDSKPVDPSKKKDQRNDTPPPLRTPIVSYDSVQTERIMLKDYDNKAVVNSAGMEFDPVVTIPSCNPIIRILYYLPKASFDPDWISYYTDTINLNSFVVDGNSWAQRKLRINKIKADPDNEQGADFMKIEVEIEVKTPTVTGSTLTAFWYPYSVMDSGTHQLDPDGGPPIPIMINGQPITKPVPLHAGLPLPSGSGVEYIDFRAYREVDFGPLFGM